MLHGEITCFGENRVQGGGGITLAQNQSVALFPSGIGRAVAHPAEIQAAQDFHAGEGPAVVSRRAAFMDHAHDMPAEASGMILQLPDLVICNHRLGLFSSILSQRALLCPFA